MTLNSENLIRNNIFPISVIFSFFPISFIFGNLVTNVNILVFCCIGLFYLRSNISMNKINFPFKLIFLFFLLILFSTFLNFIESFYSEGYEKSYVARLSKSILFLRFFLILLIVYFLTELNLINFKFFFITSFLFPVLISLDVIFQYIFGFNIVGMESSLSGHAETNTGVAVEKTRHNPSFFGDENISGGYIQNFSFFSILFLSSLFNKNNNFYHICLTTLVICILATGIMLSGNRMPFYLFLIGLFLLFFMSRNLKKIILISFFCIYLIFIFISSFDKSFKEYHSSFYDNFEHTVLSLPLRIKNSVLPSVKTKETSQAEKNWELTLNEDAELNPYKKLVLTALETWKPNKLFGNGIKSFRYECGKIIINQNRGLCSNHPHNYYLEILIDLGIVGLILTMVIALIFLAFLIKNLKKFRKDNSLQNLFLLAATISLFLATFPIKSTGSIFTTSNATYVALLASIILSYKKLQKKEILG